MAAGPGSGDLLLDLRPAGTAEEIARLFPPPDYFTAFIDGAAARDKASLLAALAAAFRFPSYFGGNWDALLDCLRSLPLEVPAAGGYVLAVKNPSGLLSSCPEETANLMDVAAEADGFLLSAYKARLRIVYF